MRGLDMLFDLALRAAVLGAIGIIASLMVRRWGAEAEHAIWKLILAAMLALPFLIAVIPPLRILPSASPAVVPSYPVLQAEDRAAPMRSSPRTFASPQRSSYEWTTAVNWTGAGIGVYLAIAGVMLSRIAFSVRRAGRIVSLATRVEARLLDDMAYPRPEVRESVEALVPFTAGWRRPVIVLPATWREWSEFKLRSVLTHELTHVRRGDWMTSAAAAVNCAVFWFHPLSWWIEKRLAVLAEEACDAMAVRSTGDAPEYANVVLEFAQIASANALPGASPMAQSSKVGQRIRMILQASGASRTLSGFGQRLMLAVALPVIYISASLQTTGQAATGTLTKSPPSAYSSMPRSEAYRAILSDGWKITASEATALETDLQRNPEDISLRLRLVSYYTQYMVRPDLRTAHLLWLIENHPDTDVFRVGSVVTHVFSDYTGLNSPSDAERARALWLRQTERYSTNPLVLANAAIAFANTDGRLSLDLIDRVRKLEPTNPEWLEWLANVYALTIRKSFAASGSLTQVGRSNAANPGFSLPPEDAASAIRALETSKDGALLSATAEVLLRELALVRTSTLPFSSADIEASEAYGKQLQARARQLDPNTR